MSRVLSSLRIVHKIIGISGAGVLGLLVVGGIYLSGQASRDRYGDIAHEMQAVAGLASKLHIELLESRRAEKDFLLRNDTKYTERYAELARTIGDDLSAIATSANAAGRADLSQSIALIRRGFYKYVDEFGT